MARQEVALETPEKATATASVVEAEELPPGEGAVSQSDKDPEKSGNDEGDTVSVYSSNRFVNVCVCFCHNYAIKL